MPRPAIQLQDWAKFTMPDARFRVIIHRMDETEPKPLYWEADYEIVLALVEHHPNTDLDTLGLSQLLQMIVALPGFADDPTLAHDGLLTEILREWYEEIYDQ